MSLRFIFHAFILPALLILLVIAAILVSVLY